MARQEHDREDLLREATALVARVEVRTASEPEPVVIGFRRDGCASVYFGAAPAYHFNTRGALRRAYVDDRLWKARAGGIVALTRERTANQVQLISRPLTEAEQRAALDGLRERLRRLERDLSSADGHSLIGQAPTEADVLSRARAWLAALDDAIAVAARSNAE